MGIAIDGFNDRGDYDIIGIVSVFLSLLLEAVAVNFEEYLLSDCRIGGSEVMALVFSIGTIVTFVGCIVTGEIVTVVEKIEKSPEILIYLGVYSIMGALGLHFVFFSLMAFGSMQTVMFTSMRKMLMCIVSGVIRGESTFGWWYRGSVCLSVVGLTANAWLKSFEFDSKGNSETELGEPLNVE